MKQKEFEKEIKEKTGLEIGKNWGLLLGTFAPYEAVGLMSSSMVEGFICWVKKGSEVIKQNIKNKDNPIQDIIQFLNKNK